MNICLLSRHFGLETLGLGRVSMEIRDELIRQGHNVKTISARGLSIYTYFFYTFWEIPFRLPYDFNDFDIYHALTPMEAIYIPKDNGVVTFFDIAFIKEPRKMGTGIGQSWWKRWIAKEYFEYAVGKARRCEKIVAVSDKTKQALVEHLHFPERKVEVIELGIRNDLNPQKKKDDMLRVGYLGALDRRKRVRLLVDAFKESTLGELVIGGVGADEQEIKAQANNDSRIKFLGLVDEGLVDFYNSLDVFVFPTWLDSWGLPIVEAMACKKPVIVLADAEIPQEIKSRCVATDDLDALLSNRNQLEKLGASIDIEGNYRWAKEHSWKNCVDKYLGLYRELIGK